MKKYDFYDKLLPPLLVVASFVEDSMCSVLPTIWLRLSEEALFSKTTTYQKGNHEIGRRRTCARSRRVSRATRSQLWTCWEMVAMLQTSLWLDNQSNRNHPADQLQLILIFSFAANQKLMFQTGDAGCLCFKSFTLEDDFIWKKSMWYRCPSDKQWRPSTALWSQPMTQSPAAIGNLGLYTQCVRCAWIAWVHSWTLPAEQHASVHCTGEQRLSAIPSSQRHKCSQNENIQSNCVKAGPVVQVQVVQVCQAAGRLKSDSPTTYLPAPPVLAYVLSDLTSI